MLAFIRDFARWWNTLDETTRQATTQDVQVDIPKELAWVSKVAYRQGYEEGDEPRAENRYELGTLEHESWRLGAERAIKRASFW